MPTVNPDFNRTIARLDSMPNVPASSRPTRVR